MHPVLPKPRMLPKQSQVPEVKMKDLESTFRFMPLADKEYYHTIMKKLAKSVYVCMYV